MTTTQSQLEKSWPEIPNGTPFRKDSPRAEDHCLISISQWREARKAVLAHDKLVELCRQMAVDLHNEFNISTEENGWLGDLEEILK